MSTSSSTRITAGADIRLANALENAVRGARQAASLTAKLLTFARQKPLQSRLVGLKQLVSSMSDLLQRTLGETIVVRTIVPEELWPVEVDPTELESALLNLAVNARDAMPDGGKLVIEAANIDRNLNDLSCEEEGRAGAHVLLSVRDSGLGMAQEVLSRVFEPFFTIAGVDGTGKLCANTERPVWGRATLQPSRTNGIMDRLLVVTTTSIIVLSVSLISLVLVL